MTAPALAAARFGWACVLGAGLGAFYDFLRPLRPRRTGLADTLFLGAAAYAWLVLGFGICGGDLRLGYSAGLFAGGLAWEWTAGRVASPFFALFWKGLSKIWGFLTQPLIKISKIAKKLFASGAKWVTIKWSNRQHYRRISGGTPDGKIRKHLQSISAGVSAQPHRDQDCGDSGPRIVYWSPDHSASDHE